MSAPCTSEDFWESTEPLYDDVDEGSTFHSTEACLLGRGCYLSIASVLIYFSVILVKTFHDFGNANVITDNDETNTMAAAMAFPRI